IAGVGDTGTPSYTTSSNFAGRWGQTLRVYSGRVNSSISAAFGNHVVTAPLSPPDGTTPITYSITGLTALAGDDVVVCVPVGIATGNLSNVYAASITGYGNALAAYDDSTSAFPGLQCSLDKINVSAGAFGPLSCSVTSSVGASLTPAAYVFALP